MQHDVLRLRSFIERYVIERAKFFSGPRERQDAYDAVLTARSIYFQIGQVAERPVDCAEDTNGPQ